MSGAQVELPFPQAPVVSLRTPQISVHAVSRPAGTYTGDFYYYTNTPSGFWAALGDVAGKGLHAAIFMAMIHEELEGLATDVATPCTTVRTLNTMLREVMPRNKFATMAAVHLSADGTLNVANAGHPPVFLRRASGTVESFHSHGAALGFFDNARWHAATTRLEPGDALLMVSDGLVEARREEEEFGVDRVAESLNRIGDRSASGIADRLLDDVNRFANGIRHDDQTLLVAVRG